MPQLYILSTKIALDTRLQRCGRVFNGARRYAIAFLQVYVDFMLKAAITIDIQRCMSDFDLSDS